MDYKEKYEQALEIARDFIERQNPPALDRNIMSKIFPELKESEDEKIRKSIIGFLKTIASIKDGKTVSNEDFDSVALLEWAAWLEKQGELVNSLSKGLDKAHERIDGLIQKNNSLIEQLEKQGEQNEQSFWEKCNRCKYFDGYDICLHKKNFGTVTNGKKENCKNNGFFIEKQGEQKPTDKVEPKFRVGDWVTNGHVTYQIIDSRYWYSETCVLGNVTDIDKTFHLYTIQDAKDGDVLAFDDETIVIFKDLYNSTTFHSYCHIEEGAFNVSQDDMPDWWEGKGFHPATKEQRDLLFQKMKEAGYEWDAEKKELRKIERNLSWSEEDEKMISGLISIVEDWYNSMSEKEKEYYGDCGYINWLKSLKERMKGE